MDDKNQTQAQNKNYQQPQGGAGTLVKELEPTPASQTERVSEFVKPSETEPKLRELEEIGVRPISEPPELRPSEQKIGISPVKEPGPLETVPTGYASITMTEEAAKETLKNARLTDSIKWRAALIVKFFKRMHGKLLGRSY